MRKILFTSLACLFIWIIDNSAYAQSILEFKHFTQKDGLASNHILSIYQDHLGFIWIGTENGLNRFDGKHFLRFGYDPEDNETLNGNWVSTITEDKELNLWMHTENGLNLLNRNTGKIERIQILNEDNQTLNPNSFHIDLQGNLWVFSREGLFKLTKSETDEHSWEAEYIAYGPSLDNKIKVSKVIWAEATAEALWLITPSGIDRLELASQTITTYPHHEALSQLINANTWRATVNKGKGKIYLGLRDKIYVMDRTEKNPQLRPLPHEAFSNQWNPFEGISSGSADEILVYSFKNVSLLNTANMGIQQIRNVREPAQHLVADYIRRVYKDRQGNYWVGTAGSGMYVGQSLRDPFRLYRYQDDNPDAIAQGQIRSFYEDENANLWVGILNYGLEQFSTKPWYRIKKRKRITSTSSSDLKIEGIDRIVKIIAGSDGDLWIASLTHGLIRTDSTASRFQHFLHRSGDSTSLSANRIWALAQDKEGNIWAGSWEDGLNRIDPKSGKIKRFIHHPIDPNSLGDNRIRFLYTDRKGLIWIGTEGGLGRFTPETGQFFHYKHNPEDPLSLSDDLVWAIHEDKQGMLWIGTNTGLNRFDPNTSTFHRFYERDGLPDNTVYGILEDDEGILWVSTENGLARKLPQLSDLSFYPFGLMNGLETASFLPKAYLNSAHSPYLYFGSTEGILLVKPAMLQQADHKPNFALHAVSRFNTAAKHNELITDYFLDDPNQVLRLGHHDQTITFTIADLNWVDQNKYQYEYLIEGLRQGWLPLEANMQISFNKLSPGDYTLKLRAKDFENNHSESSELLRVEVSPPWWQSSWAYISYLVLIAFAIFLLYRFQLRRKLLEQEARQLKELDAIKSRFFTNISHEFRTPLTIISGMVAQIKSEPTQWMDKGMELIQRNSNQLLSLINQILDLRKLEANALKPNLIQGDLIEFIRHITHSFSVMAGEKNIRIHYLPVMLELNMDYDPDKMMQIISNLLSNAIKYMPEEGGDVYVQIQIVERAKKERLHIQIRDTGIGISPEALPYIFDRFYQVENLAVQKPQGSGIGLALTQELIKLLGGSIEVESQLAEGTSFHLFFLIQKQSSMVNAPIYPSIEISTPLVENNDDSRSKLAERVSAPPVNIASGLPSILIVEDNLDIQQYLTACLEKHYQVIIAQNGQEGIDMALEVVPELIVSDVMMPIKDGFELCDFLKNDERTSHIPIILLTARSGYKAKISGLKKGADAYLTKPFEPEELLVRLEQLLQLRQKLQRRYSQLASMNAPASSEENKLEDAFILKVKQVVLDHISEEDFNTARLCKSIGLGRTQLHNKIKALTGQSTSAFVRSIRLHKAKELLQTTDLNVSEVSYEIGISNPTYFSRLYREMFGISPREQAKAS